MKIAAGLIICLLGCWPNIASAGDLASAASRLGAADTAEQLDAITRQIEQERQAMSAKLVEVLRGPSSAEVKARACLLAGQFGDRSTVDALIESIDLYHANPETLKIPLIPAFPCEAALAALARLGPGLLGPGIENRILMLLGKTDDPCRRELAVETLRNLAGEEEAIVMVRQAFGRARGDDSRRLDETLRILALGNYTPPIWQACRGKMGPRQ